MNTKLTILSLGAGVQSTTLALMARHGEIKKPDYAIFADTGWEPKHVYEHLEWLMLELDYPVHIVSHGNIKKDLLNRVNSTGQRFASIPFFIENPDGSGGIGRRQCTNEYKLQPLRKATSRLLTEVHGEKKKPGSVEMMIGITMDEIVRMKPSRVKYIQHIWPLVDLKMSRNDCKKWMLQNGYPEPPKSACLGCPYHDNRLWRKIRDESPEEWNELIEIDKQIRKPSKFKGRQYMHRSLKPLDEVDLRNDQEKGQSDLFGAECEGMCGL